jgi:FkbM family methyltransferase
MCSNGERWLVHFAGQSASTFIDVGANLGEWSAAFLAAAARPVQGLLIEPGKTAAELLRQRFRSHADIEIVESAASDHMGDAVFYEESGAGQTSSLISEFSQPGAAASKVRLTTLDAELARRPMKRVDIVKIDAEGYDCRVLLGASGALAAQRFGIVQFEYNRPWANAGSTLSFALKFLGQFDYEVFLLKSRGLYRLNYARYREYYCYSTFVAISPQELSRFIPYVRGVV